MKYLLLAVGLLLCIVNTPQPVAAAASVSANIQPPLVAGETYANAWAAAGPTPPTLNPPCGANGNGVRNASGSLVECPAGASTGTVKSAKHGNGDNATAGAWAKISGGVGTASAPASIPSKPIAFAGAAAYAKANATVPVSAKTGVKVGGVFTITYGNLTLSGWSEPVDNLTLVVVDDLGPHEIPNVLANVLDQHSIQILERQGFTFKQATHVYFSIPMVLQGKKGGTVKFGRSTPFKEHLPTCGKNFEQTEEACLVHEKTLSEKDFKSCTADECHADELRHSLKDMFEVNLYIPWKDLPNNNISVHEISCVKSRRLNEPPPKDNDICSLLLHIPQESFPLE